MQRIQLADTLQVLRKQEVTSNPNIQLTNVNNVEEPRRVYSPRLEQALALANGTFGAALFLVKEVIGLEISVEATAESSYTYAWDWGDTNTTTATGVAAATQTHNYTAAGEYIVTLVVTDGNGTNAGTFSLEVTVEEVIHVGRTNQYGLTWPQRYVATVEEAYTYLPGVFAPDIRDWRIIVHDGVVETASNLDLTLDAESIIVINGTWEVNTLTLPLLSGFEIIGTNRESTLKYTELILANAPKVSLLRLEGKENSKISSGASYTTGNFANCIFTTTASSTETEAFLLAGVTFFDYCQFQVDTSDLDNYIRFSGARAYFNFCRLRVFGSMVGIQVYNSIVELSNTVILLSVERDDCIGIQTSDAGELYMYNSTIKDYQYDSLSAVGRVGVRLGNGTSPLGDPSALIQNCVVMLASNESSTRAVEVYEDGRSGCTILNSVLRVTGTNPSVVAVSGVVWTGNKLNAEGIFGCVISNSFSNINMVSPTTTSGSNLTMP